MMTVRNRLRALPVFEHVVPDGTDLAALPANPLPGIADWIFQAAEAGQDDPHAMVLCTVGADGTPSTRTLLCKDIDEDRLYFGSHSDSRKGLEISGQPRVAAHFYWPAVGRQLRITGTAAALDRTAAEADFGDRGRGSQLSSHLRGEVSPVDRAEVLRAFDRLSEEYPEAVPCPKSWAVYGIRPDEVEFWQASPDRIHQRLHYRREADGWSREYLWP